MRRASDGHLSQHRRRALDVLPGRERFSRPESRRVQMVRLIAKVPSIAAYAFRHSISRPYVLPDNDLSYPGNFLNMLFKMTEIKCQPNPVLERALDVLFILHADLSRTVRPTRCAASAASHVDPYDARGCGCRALQAAARRRERGSPAHAAGNRIKNVRTSSRVREGRLMGFGHRVYKSYDPRAKIIKRIADLVFTVTGKNPLLEIALELERIALQDG